MDVLSQIDELDVLLKGVVANIAPDQLGNPTPCAEFDVRGVLNHMVTGADFFGPAFTHTEPSESNTDDVLAAFAPSITALFGAIHSPGALERKVAAPFGEVPGEAFARYIVVDGIVHGWDLSTATGQPYTPSDELVAAAEACAREMVPQIRDGGATFGDEAPAPAGATAIERLAAFTGRKV